MTRDEVWKRLNAVGVTEARASFSGGNDEGYVEEPEYFNKAGQPVQVDIPELEEAIADPVYEQYGSFAGDFNVSGYVVWKNGKVKLCYSETEWVDKEEWV